MDKKSILERLHKEGHISFDELMILAQNQIIVEKIAVPSYPTPVPLTPPLPVTPFTPVPNPMLPPWHITSSNLQRRPSLYEVENHNIDKKH